MELGPRWSPLRRLPTTRRLVAVAAGATLVTAGAVAYAFAGPTSADDAVPVATVQVDRGTVTVAVAATGAVEPAEDRQLGFGVAGTVTQLDVRLGQDVAAGDVLAAIDDSDATEAVEQAQEALTAAQEALVTTQSDAQADAQADDADTDTGAGSGCPTAALAAWTAPDPTASPTPGATGSASPDPSPTVGTTPTPSPTASVPAGSPTPTPTPTGAPANPSASAPTAPTTGSGGQPGTDTGCGAAPDGSTGAGGTGTGSGPGDAAGGGSGGDPVLRARQQVTAAQLRLAAAEDDLAGTVISAPIDGKVLGVSGAIGSTVRAGGTFIELAAVAEMQVTASFPEADAARLVAGQSAVVTVATRPDEEFPARLSQVDPVGGVDGQMVRYGVIVDFDDIPAGLLVGQSAGVRIVVDEVADVVRLPITAVGLGPDGEDVVVVPDGTGARQERVVTVGIRGDQYVEVTDGLAVGDEVVGG
ncbi:efflux RND transporter periplasmic adaptor subunit [Micromonospora sp. NBC_01813]|uniref:efflux RND transporter periplasmic adaptor subunit n=1 Tax=Micromonospora sp. NBC_01813 TaxID=2975988 RepID=UPI002DD967A8|nr:efflux RND transporter periplasmic adaptor subunit [Micromonospora sp. NBC_01813]WSA07351.1 efflux RND transporter periplasmic adaptor subunit [Micromonospora sp. NBC_01813]